MDLLPDAEQDAIVASVSAFLAAELPMVRVRAGFGDASNVDRSIWAACAELGWFGLGLAEERGGVGYGLAEEALLFRELGRHLTPGPFLSTVLAARVAARAGERQLTASILDGSTVVGAGLARSDGELDLIDCAGADLVLVSTRDRAALLELSSLAAVETTPCLDPATRIGRARREGAEPIASITAAEEPLLRRGEVLVAAMLSGIAESARDMAAEHARTRVQFGRPIGVHQAVKHACTDMAVRAELATFQTFLAALALDRSSPDADFQVAAARAVATDAAARNARANIQVHGGMGFTWEHDAHLLVKRTHVLALVVGDRRENLDELITLPVAR